MGVGDVRNPCKCAGCSLQKGALNVGLFNMLTHILFVTFTLFIWINTMYGQKYTKELWVWQYLQIDKAVTKSRLGCNFPGQVFGEIKPQQHIDYLTREQLTWKIYILTQYFILPFIAHYVLIHGALARSYCCCFLWIVYTFLYILADIIHKGITCHWDALYYLPHWLLQFYYVWIVLKFKEEIVLYGKIKLPLRVARCPYYFKPPKDYNPRQDFIPSSPDVSQMKMENKT